MIPAYNEEMTIAGVILKAEKYGRVLVCDDGSTDRTKDIAARLASVISHPSNQGKGAALRDLFKAAIHAGGDEVVTMDADGQHDAAEIPSLLAGLKDADIVIGHRPLNGIRGKANSAYQRLSGSPDIDIQSGFRAYKGRILSEIMPSEMGYVADTEILQEAVRLKLKISQAPIRIEDVPNPHKSNVALHFSDVVLARVKLSAFKHPLLVYGLPGLITYIAGDFMGDNATGLDMRLIGLFAMQAAVLIWTTVTITRRSQS